MRVVSGKYRGRKLNDFQGQNVRPTSDRAKEGIFSAIQFDLPGKKFLDGFAGSGAMGIEALSRGAKEVVFVDKQRTSLELVKKNLNMLGENQEVLNYDLLSYLKRCEEKFDIIFLDPPYASDDGKKALEIIAKRDLLNKNGYVIFESGNAVNDVIEGLFISKHKKYGICEFTFYSKVNSDIAVFAGSFDPITNGHIHIVKKALENFKKVIVALGINENKNYTFTKAERINMLEKVFSSYNNVKVTSFDGYLVDFLRENNTIYNIRGIRNDEDLKYEEEMFSFNKKLFPEIKNIYIKSDENMKEISSTRARELLKDGQFSNEILPEEIKEIVNNRPIV